MKEIVIASNNLGKINEFRQIFNKYGIKIIPQSGLNVPEIDEPFSTFVENSLHKARHCAKVTGLPALADDSGLCVNILNSAPGIFSARYAGEPKSDQANIDKLIEKLDNTTNRSAYFYCSLIFIRCPEDPQPIIAEGILKGKIDYVPRGKNGHGYDPIFWVPEYQQTLAELEPSQKNQISHRAIAIQDLIVKLNRAELIE